MLPCKNKLFKKLLFFSFVFLFFSVCCNQIICASQKVSKNKTVQQTQHVKTQQKRIISKLERIEDRLVSKQEFKNGSDK